MSGIRSRIHVPVNESSQVSVPIIVRERVNARAISREKLVRPEKLNYVDYSYPGERAAAFTASRIVRVVFRKGKFAPRSRPAGPYPAITGRWGEAVGRRSGFIAQLPPRTAALLPLTNARVPTRSARFFLVFPPFLFIIHAALFPVILPARRSSAPARLARGMQPRIRTRLCVGR